MPYLLFLSLLLFCACGSEPTPNAPATETPGLPRESEEERLLRLSSELTPDTSRAGRERNAIINTAIDRGWSLLAAPEGYFYEILDPGQGELIAWGDRLRVHYTGSFLDGRVFDDSRRRGRPIEFYVGNMINAWNLGLQRLRPEGRMRIVAPSALAYGAQGFVTAEGDTLVPPNEVLVFLVEEG